MNEELDDLTWLKLNFQNRIVERTLKICGMTINDIINREENRLCGAL